MKPVCGVIVLAMVATLAGCQTPGMHGLEAKAASFRAFEQRAEAGERLTVVFFGASLTWGANASDPVTTSYRANVAREFEAAYPKAHFRFVDAAIGGTNSQLGVFRLRRDVLRHQPDLVFLDFTANDGINEADDEKLASYESLVRRLVLAEIPVVQVIFPFERNAKREKLPDMVRRDAHYRIHDAYGTGLGDAVKLAIDRIESGQVEKKAIWDLDGVHPGDAGYRLFADAAWAGYLEAVRNHQVCHAPDRMLYSNTYMTWSRVRLSTLGPLPRGWRAAEPNRTSAWYDALMTRWLDSEVVAANRVTKPGPTARLDKTPCEVKPLRLRVQASMILFFGEKTLHGGAYQVVIDGKPVSRAVGKKNPPATTFGANAGRIGGNTHLTQLIATGLDPAIEHTVEIVPVFKADEGQELRLESVCVAGGPATVRLAD